MYIVTKLKSQVIASMQSLQYALNKQLTSTKFSPLDSHRAAVNTSELMTVPPKNILFFQIMRSLFHTNKVICSVLTLCTNCKHRHHLNFQATENWLIFQSSSDLQMLRAWNIFPRVPYDFCTLLTQLHFVKNLKFSINWFPLGLQCSQIFTRQVKMASEVQKPLAKMGFSLVCG